MLSLRGAGNRRPFFISLRLLQTQTTATSKNVAPTKWSPDSVRTGVVARKRGMTALWNDQGVRIPVTVLQVNTLDKVMLVVRPDGLHIVVGKLPSYSKYCDCQTKPVRISCGSSCSIGSPQQNDNETNVRSLQEGWCFPKEDCKRISCNT
jgi:hypothetical protein